MDVRYDTPTLLYASVMDEIQKSLEGSFKVNFFHFARRITDLTPFSISTNRVWHLKYKQEYEHCDTFMDIKKIKNYKNIYLWGADTFKTKKERQMHEERAQSFGIPPGISLINKQNDFVDTYSFSSSLIFQDRINALLNQTNELLQFGIDFSKKIAPIILEYTKKNSFLINNFYLQPILPTKPKVNSSVCYSTLNQFNNEQILTRRQIECIYCISRGLTSAQTGEVLNISKRTVESILNSILIKSGCINRYNLIYYSTKYGLLRDDMISPVTKLKIDKYL